MILRVALSIGMAAALAACSGQLPDRGGDSSASASPPAAGLTITVDPGKGVARKYTLTCAPPGGTVPDPAVACQELADFATRGVDPFAVVPPDQACALIYGGPATATVTGTWNGAEVDARLSREDGCQIARWDALAAVVPVPTKG